jgi:hypothetical protein
MGATPVIEYKGKLVYLPPFANGPNVLILGGQGLGVNTQDGHREILEQTWVSL